MISHEADVAVIGSGFSGCLAALILHRIGLKPVLVDTAFHPRFAIGESSTPTADLVLRDLADRYNLPRLRPLTSWGAWQCTYPDVVGGMKRGFSFFRHESGRLFDPDPDHRNELLVTASSDDEHSDTHWLRADVDAFFAGEVRREGIPFFEGTNVTPSRIGTRWLLTGRTPNDDIGLRASFIIDASGSGGFLSQALDLGSMELRTRSRGLFGHFRGLPYWQDAIARSGARTSDYPFPADAAAMHHLLDGAWMWMLRFNNGITSAGFAIDADRYPLDTAVTAEEEWGSWLARYPSLRDLFGGAELVSPPGRLVRSGRLQRRVTHAAGPGWAMLPHAAGFVDPLYSTGIAHSLCGLERLMRVFETSWGRVDLAEGLEDCSRSILTELDFVDRLVHLAYRSMPSFREFTTATMFYFAAATCYEHLRATSVGDRLFLLADDPRLRAALDEATARVAAGGDPDSIERFAEEMLAPFNRVGLFHSNIPNMYAYTALAKT